MDSMFVRPKKRDRAVRSATPTHIIRPETNKGQTADTQPLKSNSSASSSSVISKTRTSAPQPPKKASWWRRQSKKKRLLLIGACLVLLLTGGGASAFLLTRQEPAPVVAPAPEPEPEKIVEAPKPTTVAGKLTGLQIDPSLNERGVTAVMIENSIDARPQSGLLEAGIVYEAIAEGGITRFMALYQEGKPEYIGPVRSARPYYIDWLLPYNATYAHAGGSAEALQMIRNLQVRDMDHGANGSSFERVNNRFAPHNLYTGMTRLDAIREKRGYGNPDFTSFERKEDTPAIIKTVTSVDLNISSANFRVKYEYEESTNSYKRIMAGRPHIDEKSGAQLKPKVVVALVIPYRIHPDGVHSQYQTTGTGQAYVFQDGMYYETSWNKPSQSAPLELKDAGGRILKLNAGQTWITAVGQASMVSYSGPPINNQ